MQCKPKSHPANLICHAFSRYEYVRANIIRRWKNWLRFAYSSWQCLVKSCSKRKWKYWVLERNGTFKFKITPDRQNDIQNLNYYVLPDPPLFLLPSTFNSSPLKWKPVSADPLSLYVILPGRCINTNLEKKNYKCWKKKFAVHRLWRIVHFIQSK